MAGRNSGENPNKGEKGEKHTNRENIMTGKNIIITEKNILNIYIYNNEEKNIQYTKF
jgi:hypothetical protein